MEITKKHWVVAGVGFGIAVLVVTGVTQFMAPRRVVAPQPVISESPTTESTIATTSEPKIAPISAAVSVSQSHSVPVSLSIEKGDSIASWNFVGAYTNNPELVAKANAEITRLSGLLETATSSVLTLSVSIANDYDLLGDGKQEYEYLSRAIKEGGETTGLPWHNLGVLMEKLGAYETARVAYQKSTIVQPQSKQWQFSYLEFLTTRMKDKVTDIEKAFTAAFTNLGQDTDILDLQSAWKAS